MTRIASIFIVLLLVFSCQSYASAAENQQPDIISEAAVLLDSETGAVLYAKNADKRMYPASLTKIVTAIYAIEKGKLDSTVTVSRNAVRQEGTRVYLNEGEQVPLKKLIQGMLINSGNDAAVAIAEHIDGSVDGFANNINSYLKTTIGISNTHFINPNGLFNENHYTTAMDLAIITNYAIKNPVFAEIFGIKELLWEGESWKTNLLTHHRMLKGELPYPGITGGKTGFTTESKQTLATTVDNGKIKLTAIVLKSEQKKDKYTDTAHLFDYGFKAYQHSLIKQGEKFNKGKNEFYPEVDTVISEPVDGSLKEVSENGILSVKNKNGQVVQLVQLKYKEPELKKVPRNSGKSHQKEQQAYHVNALYGIIIIAFAGIFISIRKKISKKY